ncbi:MAG: NAD(P)H-dependent oxidoreductase [Sphingobacteriales bacterium JAD_PAG50586_3]|nr:MAG: NAD(P)H-dependent oxidoreductase [Sphingobacteriales bacterium JAD_PAG50586_3]
MKVLIISSSTRKGRTSHRVAVHLNNRFNNTDGIEARILDLAEHKLPMFEEVYVRDENPTDTAKEVAKMLNWADAMVFLTPEYNGTYAPALKNLVDYYNKTEFIKKAIGIVTISTGALAGMRSAVQLQNLIAALFGYVVPYMLPVGNVTDKFEEDGTLKLPLFENSINNFVAEFLWLADAVVAKKELAAVV